MATTEDNKPFHERKIDEIDNGIKAMQGEIKAKEEGIKAKEGEIRVLWEKLQNENDENNKKILNDEIDYLKGSIAELRGSIDYLRGSIADMKKEKEDYRMMMLATAQQPQVWGAQSKDAPAMSIRVYSGTSMIGRDEVKKDIKNCLRRVLDPTSDMWAADGEKAGKSKMISLHGIKGEGKTLTLQAIVGGPENQGLAEAANGGRAVTVSYNEDKEVVELKGDRPQRKQCFAAQLLYYNGMDLEGAKRVASLEDAVLRIRRELRLDSGKALTIGVDELVKLVTLYKQGDLVKMLLSDLLAFQDTTISDQAVQDKLGGPVVFVFTSLTSGFMADMVKTRVKHSIPLSNLDSDHALALVQDDALKELIAGNTGVKQLFASCCGHPRMIVDGFCKSNLTTHCNDADLIKARTTILDACKFEYDHEGFVNTLDATIPCWFDPLRAIENREALRNCGVLARELTSTTTTDSEFISPLILQWWAGQAGENNLLAHHLHECYSADAILREGHEKDFESLTMHYEAVLKCAIGTGREVLLRTFFKGAQVGEGLATRGLQIKIPSSALSLIVKASSFQHSIRGLNAGFTVVSGNVSEEGVEYMTPFFEDNKLLVGLVQNKLVNSSSETWTALKDKIKKSPAVKYLDEHEIEWFPIFYTTRAQGRVAEGTCENGVYFVQPGMDEFTRPLGPLRLHVEKKRSNSPEKKKQRIS